MALPNPTSCIIYSTVFMIAVVVANDEPQKVLIESNETWQSGLVLIYSTVILIALRLASTVRHSPLSPIHKSILRLHAYAIAMLFIGATSSLAVLLLSVFTATRDTARDLMPCAAPLLAIGGILALYQQTQPPQWDAQLLTALIGVPPWLAFTTALLFNGMTVAASVLNGAWAATSISLATTLVAVFGPRTPVVQNTFANGIIEPGGPLIFKVRQYGEKAIIALSFSNSSGKVIREFVGPSWTKLQSIDEFRHDGRLRIGAYPSVSKVVVNEEQCTNVQLLDPLENPYERSVQLISGETSDTVGFVRLQDWMRNPFGDDITAIQISMDPFTMEVLGSVVWSACIKVAESDFPGAFETYGLILRRLLEPMPRPDFKALDIVPNVIDFGTEMGVTLDEYDRSIMRVETITEQLPQPHRNIMRAVLMSKLSAHYRIHVVQIVELILDAVAGAISGDCRASDDRPVTDVEELCVIFDGIDDGLIEDDEIYAVVTDKKARTVHWIPTSERTGMRNVLSNSVHAIILSNGNEMELGAHVEAIRLSPKSDGKLKLSRTAIPIQTSLEGNFQNVEELDEAQWNESRLRGPQRVWPVNWERGEPVVAVARAKGMAEIASLQAITSGIAAGSVLLGRLLGA